MNQRKGYIISEISHKRGGSWEVRLDENSYSRTRSPFPRGVGPSGSVFLVPTWSFPISTQAVALLEPSFWTYSLQIHCNGSARPRSHPSLGPVRKPWPYIYIFLFYFQFSYNFFYIHLFFKYLHFLQPFFFPYLFISPLPFTLILLFIFPFIFLYFSLHIPSLLL